MHTAFFIVVEACSLRLFLSYEVDPVIHHSQDFVLHLYCQNTLTLNTLHVKFIEEIISAIDVQEIQTPRINF